MEVNGQQNASATLARRKNSSTRRMWGRMGLRGGLGILVEEHLLLLPDWELRTLQPEAYSL